MQSPISRDSDSNSGVRPRNLHFKQVLHVILLQMRNCSIILGCGLYRRLKEWVISFPKATWDVHHLIFQRMGCQHRAGILNLGFVLQSHDGLEVPWMGNCPQ